jgi:hypothetical protein
MYREPFKRTAASVERYQPMSTTSWTWSTCCPGPAAASASYWRWTGPRLMKGRDAGDRGDRDPSSTRRADRAVAHQVSGRNAHDHRAEVGHGHLPARRYKTVYGPWVFPSTAGTLRDAENTRSQLRRVLKGTEWEGLHPHAFRRLVATRLDAKGLSAREIVDYLGHERVSMTQDVYMARRVTGALAADTMEGLGPIESGE